jgi:hypothetical protein
MPEPAAIDKAVPEVAKEEPKSAYHRQDVAVAGLRAYRAAEALGTSPGELVAALHGDSGPFTPEQIQAALDKYRARTIPAG